MADRLVTPWECPTDDCGSSATTATEMVTVFGHFVMAASPEVFTFFKTCGACNDDIEVVRCVDCPDSAERHEEALIKFGEDYADEERQQLIRKGRKTGLRCRPCLEKFEHKQQQKEKKKKDEKPKEKKEPKEPVKQKKVLRKKAVQKKKKGVKRDEPTPSASEDDDGSSAGKAAKSEKASAPPSPPTSKKSPRKTVAKKTK